MDTVNDRHIGLFRKSLILLNFVAVIYNAFLFLFITKYIVVNGLSHSLIESIGSIPRSPGYTFFASVGSFSILLLVMYFRIDLEEKHRVSKDLLTFIEMILMMAILYLLYDCYNGIILFVFADIIYNARDNKYWLWFLGISFGMLLLSNYSLISTVMKMPSLDVYISFMPRATGVTISFFRSFIDSLNMVLFILFLITYLITSLDEQSHIKEELDMVSQVNTELNSYVALTEKIAEDRERKRIAREIHDTLGHALTGIAAGVDACIVLIDSDVDRTKQQLKIVSGVIREGIGDVRRSLNKLRPGALEDRTLKDAIIKMIDEYRELSKLNISLYYEWDYIDFDNTKEDILFRMIQESITNSLRHGHAKNVEINLFNTEQCYYIIIQDDGIGSEHITYGYGLKQMKERLAMIGGSVEYIGDQGFRTMAMIPKVKGEDKNDKSTNSR